ncbi:hypothetical protein MXB_3525 [Myxobolus squamalis]|nr:hypothetical protein MXB_3525 [Myxobolus squamalis]
MECSKRGSTCEECLTSTKEDKLCAPFGRALEALAECRNCDGNKYFILGCKILLISIWRLVDIYC